MSASSSVDREAFQKLLASAFAVQESQINSLSLSAIMEVQRLVTKGELDAEGAMHRIVASALNVANATGVAVALLKGEQLIYRAGSGSRASCIGRQVTASLTVSAETNRSREILRVEDAETDTRIEASICRQFGARSLLILAIYQTRALAGVLEVLFSDAHAFRDGEVRTYQLMARQIEATIFQAAPFQAAPPERKTNPIAQLPITRCTVPQVAGQAETFLNDTGSLPGLSPMHSVSPRSETDSTAAMGFPIRNRRSWLTTKMTRNLALAAVSLALVFCWTAYNIRRQVSLLESSTRPESTAMDRQASAKPAGALPAKPTPSAQPGLVSANPANPAKPGFRRVRVGNNEVDYIGEDVTIRYFTYPPAARRRPTADSRVAYIGDDVTVRYFPSQPAVRPGSR